MSTNFAETNKVSSTVKRGPEGDDYFISRLAGYLIAMNGDPSKPRVAEAQIYFAVQTRRQEMTDARQSIDEKRIDARLRLTEHPFANARGFFFVCSP